MYGDLLFVKMKTGVSISFAENDCVDFWQILQFSENQFLWHIFNIFSILFQEEILEETVKYIEDLHCQLLERIHCQGLPSRLRKVASEDDHQNTNNMGLSQMRTLLERSLQPQLEERGRRREEEERRKLKQLIESSQKKEKTKTSMFRI